jgi:ATP-dependent RNA helicase DHX29
MAPNRKKKKPVANPARGVATVSQPSKAKVEAELNQNEGDEILESQNEVQNLGETPVRLDKATGKSVAISGMSPEDLEKHLEDAELQELIEAHSAQSQKDAARQATRLETERRTLRLHANKLSTSSWLSEDSVTELLESSKESQKQVVFRSSTLHAPIVETDLTIKVWSLKRLLESLGLPRTDEVIEHVLRLAHVDAVGDDKDYIWGLPDSLEWYGHNAEELDLALYETVEGRPASASRSPSISRPVTPDANDLPTDVAGLNKAETEISSESDDSSIQGIESDEDNDPEKLASNWLALRRSLLRIEHLKVGNHKTSRAKARVLRVQKRLKSVESDPLFDGYEAEIAWRAKLPGLFAEIQAENSLLESAKVHVNADPVPQSKPAAAEVISQTKVNCDETGSREDILEQQDVDVIFGDMFTAPESYKASKALPSDTEIGPNVRLVDFGKWAGLNPRRVLEETCKIRDKKCRVQLSLITKTTYSNRHKLTIHWKVPHSYDPWLSSLPKTLQTKFLPFLVEIQMQQIAAPTAAQSEAYISTVALFALCLTTPGQQKMSLRMPPVWRNVWHELSQARQIVVETAEKEEIKHINLLIDNVTKEFESRQEQVQMPPISAEKNESIDDSKHSTMSTAKTDTDIVRQEWATKSSKIQFQRMQAQRGQLPIWSYRQKIVDCVMANSITIISAETGAGKSTQVPSFLLENSLSSGRDCRILVTQPRRISAITLARRVSQELGELPNELGTRRSVVGYSIRLESKISASTRLTFATTGVLLRMIETSPDLDDLDYLMLDEVHERTMDMDLLFIAVRHLVARRPSLKVVLMSATVDSRKFSEYFGGAPVLEIPGRTFPVEIGYLEDAMAAVGRTTNKKEVPQEITEDDLLLDQVAKEEPGAQAHSALDDIYEYRIDYTLIVELIIAISTKPQYVNYSQAILVFMPGIGEIRRLNSALLGERMFQCGWVIHMLHSSFSTEDLERAFLIPPAGMRKIVISTNIAETGVTIPDITAVIDTCKEKIMRFDDRRQMSKLTEGFISRASSRQRRGRAARVQPGLCFHLVSRKRYDNLMLEQSIPEMLRLSLQDAILRIKIWNLGAIEQTLQQAIDPPTPKNIRRAMEALKDAGALTAGEALTALGRQVARLPLDVSLSKLAILGIILRSLDAAISIVAILSSKSPFLVSPYQNDQNSAATAKAIFARGDSDLLTIYAAYLAWQKAVAANTVQTFCRKHSLSPQVLSQIEDQKIQLLVQVVDAGLLPLTDTEKSTLRSARSGNSYTRKSFYTIPTRFNSASAPSTAISSIIAAAFYPKLLLRQQNSYRNVTSNQITSVAPNSINNPKLTPKPPKWLSFYEAMQTRSGHTNAIETSSVPEAAIVLLLGEASFNIYAGVISIDNGRVRFSVTDWKTLMALKILRGKMKGILNSFYQNAGKAISDADEKWLGLWFSITQALDRQAEMAKARLLTSAHHAPSNTGARPIAIGTQNGQAAPGRVLPQRPKEDTSSTKKTPTQTQLDAPGRSEIPAQTPAPAKRSLNPHADLHGQ